VLHLGDFVYEVVWYPEERPQGMYARKLRDIVRYAHGEKHRDFHVPTTLDDYRALYRAYLLDPDLQDARARWPFICMWDNHEFSWKCWQSQENFGQGVVPAQSRKVAANQAWFEYQPARVRKPHGEVIRAFKPPFVSDASIRDFDEHGLGREPNNLAAIESLRTYRTVRWGRNADLILTDNRTYRSEPIPDRAEAAQFVPTGFPLVLSESIMEVLDAGKAYNNRTPPSKVLFDGKEVPNPRKDAPAQCMLGAEQKEWFLEQLKASDTTWKLWGNSVAALDWRTDFQNLPSGSPKWPCAGYAQYSDDDWGAYRFERAEILDFVMRNAITGLISLAGDRHAFSAGVLSSHLPPKEFRPVAAEFITGSISAPGVFEALQFSLPKNHPLRSIYLYSDGSNREPQPAINFSILHGVKASLKLAATQDVVQARTESNREMSPHLSFVDVGGHGYSVVRVNAVAIEVEFVCIPRPIERSTEENGGPVAYRVVHRVSRWSSGSKPEVLRTGLVGQPLLSLRS
jgi:alkaline phosphatase D